MKVETRFFLMVAPFFWLVALVYAFWSGWEPVGSVALILTGFLAAMIGAYLGLTAKRIDDRPEDDPNGLIEQGAGDQGVYAPWSWWPLAIGFSAAVAFLGVALGWWLFYIGVAIGAISLIGWVFEYSRGQHAH